MPASTSGEIFVNTILYFVRELVLNASGISYKLYIGAMVSTVVVLLVAIVVVCMVTWKHKNEKALIIIRRWGVRGTGDCNVPNIKPSEIKKQKQQQKKKKKTRSLSHSQSASNLREINNRSYIGSGSMQDICQLGRHRDMTASCSALDLPLPQRPVPSDIPDFYQDKGVKHGSTRGCKKEIFNKNVGSVALDENVAYTITTPNEKPPPYVKNVDKSLHDYEHVELAQSSRF